MVWKPKNNIYFLITIPKNKLVLNEKFCISTCSHLRLEFGVTLGEVGDAVNVYPPIYLSDNEVEPSLCPPLYHRGLLCQLYRDADLFERIPLIKLPIR